jgi:predicted nuclease of restriction endonuclease-like (RecB) superfamily
MAPKKNPRELLPSDYGEVLEAIKSQIRSAQIKAAITVNREMILLYWNIGREILKRQNEQGWGAKVIERLSKDLKSTFPALKGFSRTNLLYMRAFAEAYPDEQIVQQLAGQIPWFHNCTIIDKIKDPAERLWYVQQTTRNGWSRSILSLQIENKLYQRQGKALTNFDTTLPPDRSDLARETLKDPYVFDFLSVGDEAQERAIENELVKHIERFLLELGAGFAFVGRQVPLQVGSQDYYLDLLFYHLRLRCFVVIELKATEFKPEHAGKLNFYLSAVDDLLRHPDDKPSIGILLCKSKDSVVAEYALRDVNKPISVSEWKDTLTKVLPEPLQAQLPTIEDLEAELEAIPVESEEGE